MPTASAPCCPLCDASDVHDLGPVIHTVPTLVNFWPIDLSGIEFRLSGCGQCGFWFKTPPIPEEKLLECYTRGAKLSDQPVELRGFDAIVEMTSQFAPGRRVLDIGCDTGALLAQFDGTWQKFGVEPSTKAAQLAAGSGTTILGATLDDQTDAWGEFDAILLIDVMEHIPRPMELLKRARAVLNPGGVIVIVTGDTDTPMFRRERGLYWYATITEHVSFYGAQTLQYLAGQLGMKVARNERRPHTKMPTGTMLVQYLKQWFYLIGRAVRGFGLPALQRLFVDRAAPSFFGGKDHMFVVLKAVDSRDSG